MSSQRGSDSDDDPLLLISSSYRPHKRRRVEPPVSDEIIESSDAEEREEELAAAQPGYWTKLPTPHATISVGPLGGGQRRVDDAEREQHQQVVSTNALASKLPVPIEICCYSRWIDASRPLSYPKRQRKRSLLCRKTLSRALFILLDSWKRPQWPDSQTSRSVPDTSQLRNISEPPQLLLLS